MAIPAHMLYVMLIRLIQGGDKVTITVPFISFYLVFALFQVRTRTLCWMSLQKNPLSAINNWLVSVFSGHYVALSRVQPGVLTVEEGSRPWQLGDSHSHCVRRLSRFCILAVRIFVLDAIRRPKCHPSELNEQASYEAEKNCPGTNGSRQCVSSSKLETQNARNLPIKWLRSSPLTQIPVYANTQYIISKWTVLHARTYCTFAIQCFCNHTLYDLDAFPRCLRIWALFQQRAAFNRLSELYTALCLQW